MSMFIVPNFKQKWRWGFYLNKMIKIDVPKYDFFFLIDAKAFSSELSKTNECTVV